MFARIVSKIKEWKHFAYLVAKKRAEMHSTVKYSSTYVAWGGRVSRPTVGPHIMVHSPVPNLGPTSPDFTSTPSCEFPGEIIVSHPSFKVPWPHILLDIVALPFPSLFFCFPTNCTSDLSFSHTSSFATTTYAGNFPSVHSLKPYSPRAPL